MKFKELFNKVYNLIESDNYICAMDLALEEKNTNFEQEELKIFFSNLNIESYPVYSVSGSGGSKIKKPNLTSILAFHLSEYYKYKKRKVLIYKTGSRKITSLQGSTDFIEKFHISNFIYNDDTVFNKTVQCLRFNNVINDFFEEYYVCSKKINKKIVFLNLINHLTHVHSMVRIN